MAKTPQQLQKIIDKNNASWLQKPPPDPRKKTKVKAHPWKYTYKKDPT